MLLVLAGLAVAATTSVEQRGPWTRRSLARYVDARRGVWLGGGRLTNTLTGVRLADVAFLERVTMCRDGAGFGSERVLVYRAGDGTRPCDPLRYMHNISVQLVNGNVLLCARQPAAGGAVVASGWGVGRGPRSPGLRKDFELSVRPVKQDAAAGGAPPPLAEPQGWPRTAAAARGALGVTREEYRLRGNTLRYTRTGRCPTWYGAGVCTLEVEARAQRPPLRRFWRRGAKAVLEADEAWERRVRDLIDASS